jgi:signal transduction histidine kinase
MGSVSPALRLAYEGESRAVCVQATRLSCWLGFPLIALFGTLEARGLIAAPALFPWLRLGCSAVMGTVLVALATERGRRHPSLLFMVVMLAIGEMLALMTLSTGGEASPYFVGIALVILSTAVLMPWRVRWSVATSAALLVAYAGTAVLGGTVHNRPLFCSNCALVFATGVIAAASAHFREGLRWREFCNRTALVEALQHRREFMAKMSHELRTPLHVIIGYADILLEEFVAPGDAEVRGLVERSRTSAVALHRMISDLLDYAKVEAGRMELRRERVQIADLVTRVVSGFRPLMERKNLELRLRCDDELPEMHTDPQRVEQILVNLIGNAVKFTSAGSVSVEVCGLWDGSLPALAGFRFLDAGGRKDDSSSREPQLAILVHDTGVGIRERDIASLAQDFQQVDQAAAGHYGGTGLGLSISRAFARLLGGRVAVRSRYGEGSTFALLLPAPARARRDGGGGVADGGSGVAAAALAVAGGAR